MVLNIAKKVEAAAGTYSVTGYCHAKQMAECWGCKVSPSDLSV